MDNFEENAIRIADYLEDKMSPEQEELFMRRLAEDSELRQQFEDELLAMTLLGGDEQTGLVGGLRRPVYEEVQDETPQWVMEPVPADIVYERPQQTYDIPQEVRRRRPLKIYYSAAAAVILVIAGTTLWLVNRNKGTGLGQSPLVIVAKNDTSHSPPLIASHPPIDTGAKQPAVLLMLTSNREADSAFRANYTPYTYDTLAQAPDNEWLALRGYYDAYQRGNYDSVLMATDADYAGRPNVSEDSRLKQYMHFYKGLCYLASGTTADAMQKALAEFEPVMAHASRTGSPFFEAQWYALLTTLRTGDLAKARVLVNDVALSGSPYRFRAAQLMNIFDTQ